jgi:hypothetical protein
MRCTIACSLGEVTSGSLAGSIHSFQCCWVHKGEIGCWWMKLLWRATAIPWSIVGWVTQCVYVCMVLEWTREPFLSSECWLCCVIPRNNDCVCLLVSLHGVLVRRLIFELRSEARNYPCVLVFVWESCLWKLKERKIYSFVTRRTLKRWFIGRSFFNTWNALLSTAFTYRKTNNSLIFYCRLNERHDG